MLKFPHLMRVKFCFCLLSVLALVCLPCAFAQTADFALQASTPNPSSINPAGIESLATITLSSLNGFNSPVTLSCSISPVESTNPPSCSLSPVTVTPPASSFMTFATSSLGSPAAPYFVTVTGVSGGISHSVTLSQINVISGIVSDYTLAVGSTVTPTSVHAGSGATAVINITSASDYTGKVTPGCSNISPAVEPSPACSFNPATVSITNGASANTTLTINTTGPSTTGALDKHMRAFYAFLFPLPFALIAGFSGKTSRRKTALRLISLYIMACGLLFLPACHASSSVNNGAVTPNNSYTFTINAYDANGVAASNTTAITVSLTVD